MMQKDEIEEQFKRNYGAMYRLAAMILHDEESAHDVVHDVFETILSSGKDENLSSAYLMACVRNRCVSRLRRADTFERFRNLYPDLDYNPDDEDWPDESTFEDIHRLIESLPEKCREVFKLRFHDGIPTSEIAISLNVTERSVYKHLHRALEFLRSKLVNNG